MLMPLILMASVLTLLVVGMPIAFALGLVAIAGFYVGGGVDGLIQIPLVAYQMVDNNGLLPIPLFVMMGSVMYHGKIGADFFNLAASFAGHRRAGLAIATVVACALFGAISASSLATAATIGALSVPSMLKQGYPKHLVYGPVTAGGTLGILIPPSSTMILYGAATGVSVGDLFIAGVLPGIVLTVLFCFVAMFLARGSNVKPLPRASWPERWAALRRSFWGMTLPVVVLGGLYAGFFTPSEAGAVGILLGLIVSVLIKRSLPVRELPRVLAEGTRTSGFLFAIIIASGLFNHLMNEFGMVQRLTEWVVSLNAGPTVVLLLISALLFVLGMFLEAAALILIMVPILFPIVKAMNIDPIWFGIFFVVNVELAFVTPPVGMNLFIVQEIGRRYTQVSFLDVVRSTNPYMLCLLFMLLVLLVFPSLATMLVPTRVF
jgi:C4-dicarboxylate transporter DctM subunit